MNMFKDAGKRISLNEADAKDLLKHFGIPAVKEVAVRTEEEAAAAAAEIGYPVVLKGLGSQLLHKTELGIVYVKIANKESLMRAAGEIKEKAGDKLEGFLVQQFVTGKREMVAGLIKDPQFGPMVMVGIGGIFTEAFQDISFRMAPVTESDALDMIGELRSKKMLGAFRGEAPVDQSQVIQVLIGLSKLAIEMPEIEEVDINPLIVNAEGGVCAVDALVVKSHKNERDAENSIEYCDLSKIMSPDSIAFIGASNQFGKWGQMLPAVAIANDFVGEIYLVNPKGGTFFGKRIYSSLSEIEGKIDLAIITIPAEHVVKLIPSLVEKGVKNAVVISSGYSEVGPEGKKLEIELLEEMQAAGITFIGPNLSGLGNPYKKLNISLFGHINEPGPLALISQSGNLGMLFSMLARFNNIGIACICTNGNETMVGTEDFIQYCVENENARVVAGYIEKINDGRRFYKAVKDASEKKPVVLLKGGQSTRGSIAAASHTGGMRTDSKMFNAICKQAGVIQVKSITEMLDTGAAFSYLPLPKGKRVAIMTMGGGMGVLITDLCEKYGMEVPALSDELIEEFNKLFPPFWSHANPVDMLNDADKTIPLKVMEALAKWDGCDIIIHNALVAQQNDLTQGLMDCYQKLDKNLPAQIIEGAEKSNYIMGDMLNDKIISIMKTYGKPIIGIGGWVLHNEANVVYKKDDQSKLGCLAYISPERAVSSIAYMLEYAKKQKRA